VAANLLWLAAKGLIRIKEMQEEKPRNPGEPKVIQWLNNLIRTLFAAARGFYSI
jgi:hypothetical protein